MVKAVLFDLYETLITQYLPDFVPPKQTIAERLGITNEQFAAHHQRFDDEWESGRLRTYGDKLRAICNAVGHVPDEAVVAELTEELRASLVPPFANIEDEILEMVAQVKSMGLQVCVVSNAGDLDAEPWAGCRLAGEIEHFVASWEAGVMKPDTRIYEMGLRAVGVEAHEAVYVGDGGHDELRGAAEAGLRPMWATWFVERWWDVGLVPGIGFEGDEWRRLGGPEAPFERARTPAELVERLGALAV